ncbi:hypothetical protein PAXINDRAFT_167845 [Paxillus involutus ATCC 200175]|nr:hypothetical protein PAXINDRAFT_167845 [Paxillus involutus ATCC 200175]
MRRQYPPRPHEREIAVGHHYGDASNEGEGDEGSPIYTTRRTKSAHELRGQTARSTRITADIPRPTGLSTLLGEGFGWRKPRTTQITTAPGQLGAGETETEADEPPRHLPTTRIFPASEPLVSPNVLTMFLFESSRLLSVVPASLGALINAWCLWNPPGYPTTYTPHNWHDSVKHPGGWGRRCLPDRGDYLIAVLWAFLTAHQCLKLTTGLLHRWQAYYPPLPTLIRLLALQAICWPATHFTLEILGTLGTNPACDSDDLTILESALLRWTSVRPDVCWAVIGTTTCFSRSIQIWVTSNLLPLSSSSLGIGIAHSSVPDRLKPRRAVIGEEMRKLTGRRWDWNVVARVCMLPVGCLYFVMAWIGAWRREVGGC